MQKNKMRERKRLKKRRSSCLSLKSTVFDSPLHNRNMTANPNCAYCNVPYR